MSTNIEWTDETWNAITGCAPISPGCKLCYALKEHARRHKAFLSGKKMAPQYSQPFEVVQCHPSRLDIPLHWRQPRLCFVASGADPFHEDVPRGFLDLMFAAMGIASTITFQMLTKRPEGMLAYYQALQSAADSWQAKLRAESREGERCRYCVCTEGAPCPVHRRGNTFTSSDVLNLRQLASSPQIGGTLGQAFHRPWPLPNLWPGVSVESKKYLYRLDRLREIPAAVRMVSFEPLLEDLGEVNLQGIGWAIVGGESGHGARPCHPDWVRSLRDQCVARGVPFFFKQWGEWEPLRDRAIEPSGDLYAGFGIHNRAVTRWPDNSISIRAGKKHSGAELDAREWREFPKPYPGHEVIRLQRQRQRAVAA